MHRNDHCFCSDHKMCTHCTLNVVIFFVERHLKCSEKELGKVADPLLNSFQLSTSANYYMGAAGRI